MLQRCQSFTLEVFYVVGLLLNLDLSIFQMSGIMLSPKVQRMQRSIRINDGQLLGLAEKARYDSRLAGFLYKRCADNNKWLLRWFRLYQVKR